MATSTNNTLNEGREQFLYAQDRIRQKKRLNQHFIIFLVGAVFMIVLHYVLDVGKDFFITNWSVWAIIVWAFILCVHVINVFFTHRFMGKEWENKMLDKLRDKQRKRIAELQQQVDQEIPIRDPQKTLPESENEERKQT